MRTCFGILVLLLGASSITTPQADFEVAGTPRACAYTRAELRALPNREARTIDGKVYTGVLISTLLRDCGIDLDALKGKELFQVVTVRGADGYEAVFALAELIPKFHDVQPLLADTAEGADLPPDVGPLRVFTLDAAAKARWVSKAVRAEVKTP